MEYWKFIRSKVGASRIIIPGVDVAIFRDNKVLLVKEIEGHEWFFPGGLQELNETIFETGEREVFEEVGLKVKGTSLLSVYSGPKWIRTYSNGDELQSLTFFIRAELTDDTQDVTMNENELEDVGWFSLDDVPVNMHDYSQMMVQDLKEYNGQTLIR